ncbi:Outer membrane protein TolC [Polaribacter huanghezhanensis]|uniref:TolC family protein n=1 Tax=Polaribacter huanghezhanensis TaxID=1354726 RepID=UPI002647A9E5|nr:TolC family protein [Polaribacter huanghezhanensis]WKD85661.1 Outer membrane protein TolC [Polaribacter huanghezhanensis]
MKTKFLVIIALIAFSFSGLSQKKWDLKEAVEHALKNNITIKKGELTIEKSKQNVVGSKGNFLPNLNASSGANLNFGSTIDPVSNGRISSTNFSSSYRLSSGITVFNGFRLLNTYKRNQLTVIGNQLDLQKIKDDISLNVVNSYLNILFAKENLAVAKVQAKISKKQIEVAKDQVEAGSKPKGELLNAQSAYANDLQTVVSLENTLDIALLGLAQLLQVDPNNFDVANIDVGAPSASLLFKSPDVVYKKAVITRPEILSAKLQGEYGELQIAIAKSGFLPTVTASADAGTNYSHRFTIFQGQRNDYFFKQLNDNFGYGVGVSLSIPIFNRFQNKVNLNRAIIDKEDSELNLQSAKLGLQQEIQRAFLDAKAALKSYEAAKLSLDAQQEAFKNAQQRYTYEAITSFEFDQVRNRLVNAESTLIRAKFDYVFKTKVLKFYYGESVID